MIRVTPEFLTELAHYNAGIQRARAEYAAHPTAFNHADPVLKPCGTRAAYQRHIAHNEKPCGPCRLAASDAERATYLKRKAKKAARVTGEWVSDDDGDTWRYERLGSAS